MAAQDAPSRAAAAASSGPPYDLIAASRPPVTTRSVLKIVVFNAGGGANVAGIAACLNRPPLSDAGTILVCEASWRTPRHRRVRFASELAEVLGMSFAFIPCFGYIGRDGELRAVGNAIVCAQPLDDIRAILLPGHRPRSAGYRMAGAPTALTASVNAGGRGLTMAVAHMERRLDPAGRALQMKTFLEALDGANPVVVGGDFNTTTMETNGRWALVRAAAALFLSPGRFHSPQRYEPLFQRLNEHGFRIESANVPRAPTFTPSGFVPALWRPKLDWLAMRGLGALADSAAVVPARTSRFGRRVSDHDFVVCEFRM
jgi:endonuclease/exonuclease/phosphatase family metal-dependent hydrolase